MARLASVDLHGGMLEHERPLFFRVAVEAYGVLGGRSPHLPGFRRTVNVVAVAASNQAFVHAMMEGHFELRLLLEMASVAELRLSFLEKEFFRLGMMRRVARRATYLILSVQGIDRIHVLRTAGVASQAASVDFLSRSVLEREDFCDVAAACDVGRARAMASLASLMRRSALGIERRLPMGGFLPTFINFFVAGLACVGANVISRGCGLGGRVFLFSLRSGRAARGGRSVERCGRA